eukprot:CAMPEP_0202735616 /NCGR_PEP_ID=MMETSP1388-20130828/511_1 /ASSEMBLY_ACC=CAM_ASM_000864 /TAXON_ID=37098 /ORGANISM="Isochrysis sp, Strain CCMP1244" /LENGTH=36 /DNA_ID= /DNA_START= /DNA_END= /DNA_ORIENTATION=
MKQTMTPVRHGIAPADGRSVPEARSLTACLTRAARM